MTASREALCQALGGNGAVAEALLAARTLVLAGWREEIIGQAVAAADPRLAQYLLGLLQNPYEERLHAVFLTAGDHYIRDEEIAAGSRSGLSLRMRAIVRRAFELDADKLILAHNHPSGLARPSREDRLATARFEKVARELDLTLVDHLIVGAGDVYSMRSNCLLTY